MQVCRRHVIHAGLPTDEQSIIAGAGEPLPVDGLMGLINRWFMRRSAFKAFVLSALLFTGIVCLLAIIGTIAS